MKKEQKNPRLTTAIVRRGGLSRTSTTNTVLFYHISGGNARGVLA